MIVFAAIAFEAILTISTLCLVDTKPSFGLPSVTPLLACQPAQHGAGNFAGHAADRSPAPDPAPRRIADPGLAVAFVHVFDVDAADPVGEIMILRGRHRRRQALNAELLQARAGNVDDPLQTMRIYSRGAGGTPFTSLTLDTLSIVCPTLGTPACAQSLALPDPEMAVDFLNSMILGVTAGSGRPQVRCPRRPDGAGPGRGP